MRNPFSLIFKAARAVLDESLSYRLWFAVLTILLFVAYLLLPVWLTPGNSIKFQLSLLQGRDYILFAVLSLVTALLVIMQAFLFIRAKKAKEKASVVGQGGVGVSSALFAGLLAAAACSSCVAAILGFLGAGSVFFVLENQWYVVTGAIALVLIGLYYTARRVNSYCENCEPSLQK